LKELVETRGWLKFIVIAELLSARRIAALLDECEQQCRILGKSVATAKRKHKRRGRTNDPDASEPPPPHDQ